MKHIKLFEQFVAEKKQFQQQEADKNLKDSIKLKKEIEASLSSASYEDRAYLTDKLDTINRTLVNDQNAVQLANAAAASEKGYDDPKVIQMEIDHKLLFIKDREELVDQIKAKLKAKDFDETRRYASNLVGSESDLKQNLKNAEATLDRLNTKLRDLQKN